MIFYRNVTVVKRKVVPLAVLWDLVLRNFTWDVAGKEELFISSLVHSGIYLYVRYYLYIENVSIELFLELKLVEIDS